jgi:hypothetical protein
MASPLREEPESVPVKKGYAEIHSFSKCGIERGFDAIVATEQRHEIDRIRSRKCAKQRRLILNGMAHNVTE